MVKQSTCNLAASSTVFIYIYIYNIYMHLFITAAASGFSAAKSIEFLMTDIFAASEDAETPKELVHYAIKERFFVIASPHELMIVFARWKQFDGAVHLTYVCCNCDSV